MCRYDYNTIQWQPHLNSRMPFILPRCAGALVLSTSSSRCLPFLPIHSENFHSSTEKNNIDIMINRNTFVFFYWMHISGETVRAGGRNSNVQSYSILLLLKFARSSTLFVLISRFLHMNEKLWHPRFFWICNTHKHVIHVQTAHWSILYYMSTWQKCDEKKTK